MTFKKLIVPVLGATVLMTLPSIFNACSGAVHIDSRSPSSSSGTDVNMSSTVYYGAVRATYAALLAFKYPSTKVGPAIVPGDVASSRFAQMITTGLNGKRMGDGTYGNLSSSQVQTILTRIDSGAPNDPAGSITCVSNRET